MNLDASRGRVGIVVADRDDPSDPQAILGGDDRPHARFVFAPHRDISRCSSAVRDSNWRTVGIRFHIFDTRALADRLPEWFNGTIGASGFWLRERIVALLQMLDALRYGVSMQKSDVGTKLNKGGHWCVGTHAHGFQGL